MASTALTKTGLLTLRSHHHHNNHRLHETRNKRSVFQKVSCPDNNAADNFPRLQLKWRSRFPHCVAPKTAKPLDFSSANAVRPITGCPSMPKLGLIAWYLSMINSRPILTKSMTAALIYTFADLTSQMIVEGGSERIDWTRTLRMAAYGMLIVGPSLHCWFNFASRIFPNRDLISVVAKIVLGQMVFGPTMTAIFFSGNAALQGESPSEIAARLKRDLIPTLLNGLMYWPACDFITFRFVPVHLQPLVSNSFSFVWTVYLTYMASQAKASTPKS